MRSWNHACIADFLSEISCRNDETFSFIGETSGLAKLLEYSETDMIEKSKAGLLGLIEESLKSEIQYKMQQQLEHDGQLEVLMPICSGQGHLKWIMCKGRLVQEGEQELIAGVLLDLTYSKKNYDEEKETIDELKQKAQQDSLTKIYNAATSRELAEDYLEEQEGCALFILDIDRFKKINDQHGHMFGDVVIIQAAQTLRKFFRTNDILGRVGGDEFMVLMKDIHDIDIIEKRCRQLNEYFQSKLEVQVPDFDFGLSLGVALAPMHGSSYFDLFLAADQSLYHAKELGGRQYTIYSEEICGPLKNKEQMKNANYDKNILSGYIE